MLGHCVAKTIKLGSLATSCTRKLDSDPEQNSLVYIHTV